MRAHRAHDPVAASEGREAAERVRASLQRQRKRRDATAVDADGDRRRVDLGRRRDLLEHRALARVDGEDVAVDRPALGSTEREEAGVLAGAVVLDPLRADAALEVVLGGRRRGEHPANDRELLGRRAVGGADERDLPSSRSGRARTTGSACSGFADERRYVTSPGSPARKLHPAAADGDGVDDVPRLDDVSARHLDDEWLHGAAA